jgi:hypothetical protein
VATDRYIIKGSAEDHASERGSPVIRPLVGASAFKRLYRTRAELPASVHSLPERASGKALAFVGTNPKDESIVSDLPVVRQLFGNPMLCTLLTQRLPYFEVNGDSCPLWPRS